MHSLISILVVEDHLVVRQGIITLLSSCPEIRIVGEAGSAAEAVELARRCRPDVVLMDLALPDMNGLDATRTIVRELPSTRVLVLTAHAWDQNFHLALDAGAAGFISKRVAAEVLIDGIREVSSGGRFLGPYTAQRLQDRSREAAPMGGNLTLTPRERQVLQFIAQGTANQKIAETLGISRKTVEKHRMRLMKRLSIHDVATLTKYAFMLTGAGLTAQVSAPTC